MYAIVDVAGQQFKVTKDQKIFVHRLDGKEGDKIEFDKVLLIDNNDKVKVGEPIIKGAFIKGKILKHLKGDKVKVFKKKRRKGYKVLKGHRDHITHVLIEEISEKTTGKKETEKKETATTKTAQKKKATGTTKTATKTRKPAAKTTKTKTSKSTKPKKQTAAKKATSKTTAKAQSQSSTKKASTTKGGTKKTTTKKKQTGTTGGKKTTKKTSSEKKTNK